MASMRWRMAAVLALMVFLKTRGSGAGSLKRSRTVSVTVSQLKGGSPVRTWYRVPPRE